MYIWTQHKFAFLSMAGTGSLAVSNALLQAGAVRVNNHHATPPMSEERLGRMGVPFDRTWTVATTVRGHRAWFESVWCKGFGNARKGPQDRITVEWLERFEKDKTYFPVFVREIFWKYTPYATDIWHQETLQEDVNRTMARLGAPPLILGRANEAEVPRPAWTPEAEAWVETRFGWHSRFDSMGPVVMETEDAEDG